MAQPIPLAKRSNPGRDFRDGSGRLVNCYVEPRGEEGKWELPVYPVDGLETFAELPVQSTTEPEGLLLEDTNGDNLTTEDGLDTFALEGDPSDSDLASPRLGVQQLIFDNGYLWAITGKGVYRIDQGGDATFTGAITNSDAITADVNRVNQIGIVSDGNYFVVDTLLNTVTNYTSSLLITSPNSVCHYNGYMVVTNSNNIYQISNVDDATLWDSTDVETAIFRGDETKRCLARGGELLLFGTQSLEFWQDVGATNGFTFQRAGALETGIGPPMSAANLDEAVLFIDADSTVRIVQGYATQVVSNPYISRKIREASDWSSIRATTYERDGSMFYSISCDDFTLTYNMASDMWHEEKSYGLNRRLMNGIARNGKQHFTGNYAEGIVYTLERTAHTDGSGTKPIVMEIETPPIHAFPDRLRVKSLFIDALFGHGLKPDVDEAESARMEENPTPGESIDSDEEEPKLLVHISEDGGENFSFLEELSLGDINSKYEELRVQGVGTSEQAGFVFKLTSSTPVVRGILGMSADITKVRA